MLSVLMGSVAVGCAGAGVGTADFECLLEPEIRASTVGSPYEIALADLDGDGDLDLAVRSVVDFNEGHVSILRSDARGTWTLIDEHAIGSGAVSIETGDLDGDGAADVIVGVGGDLGVLTNTGDGTLEPIVYVETGVSNRAVTLVDFDDDAILDVASVRYSSSDPLLIVRRGEGDGTFGAVTEIQLPSRPSDLTVADFDGDLDPDIAVATSGGVLLLLNDGAGMFGEPVILIDGSYSLVTSVDLTMDGFPDLAMLVRQRDIVVLINDGAGGFMGSTTYPGINQTSDIAAGDIDGDGTPDLLAVNYGRWRVQTLMNDGAGQMQRGWDFVAGLSSWGIGVGDIDGDGVDDVVAANPLDGDVSVVHGGARAETEGGLLYEVGVSPLFVTASDLDGDHAPDVVVTVRGDFSSPDDDSVIVFQNEGDGVLRRMAEFDVGAEPNSVAVGRLDDDEHPDLVVAVGETGSVSVLLNNGDRSFADEVRYVVGGEPKSVVIADLDADEYADLIVGDPYANEINVLFGAGDGTFGAAVRLGAAGGPNDVVATDLDGDGDIDVMAANHSASLVMYRNGGDGTFGLPTFFQGCLYGTSLAVGDWDGDGDIDAAIGCQGEGGRLTIYTNLGDAMYERTADYSMDEVARDLIAIDPDADGDLDLIVLHSHGSPVAFSVFENLGNGRFADRITHGDRREQAALVVSDLNGDDRFDLVIADTQAWSVRVVLGTCPACPADLDASGDVGFTDVLSIMAAWGTCRATCREDLDGSGAVDLGDLAALLSRWGPCDDA